MLHVHQILSAKLSNNTYSVQPEQTVLEALALMAEQNIGVVLVMEGDQLRGIFSERDYARKGIIQGREAKNTPISDVMTADVITISPDQSIETCMQLMSQKKFRHLPVVKNERVIGVVSIGDLVTAIIREQEFRIQSLEQYITGG
jgi:CBS domain-containing protein